MRTLARLALTGLFLIPGLVSAQEPAAAGGKIVGAPVVVSKAWYPGNKCLVLDRKLKAGKTVTVTVAGRTAKVCCKRCKKKVESSPKDFLTKLDKRVAAAQTKGYPLETCPISGEKLASIDKPHDIVVDGRLVRLCCSGCEDKARDKGAEITKQITTALVKAANGGPKKCLVAGRKVKPGKGVRIIWGNKVLSTCCKRCLKAFEKEPAKFLAKKEDKKTDKKPAQDKKSDRK